RIIDFRPIADLSALGDFGKKLAEYKQLVKEIKVNTFSFAARRNKKATISLEAMRDMLLEKKIQCRIEKRGKNLVVSFSGLPCPVCKKTSANARAYPPYYTLRCFNTSCQASGGMPLELWSGIKTGGGTGGSRHNSQTSSAQKAPKNFIGMDDARDRIREALKTEESSLIVVTPGVGKSQESIKYLVEETDGKTVFYSCFNRALKQEAYDKAVSFSSSGGKKIHLLKSLDELCKRPDLKQVIERGFSPTEILCPSCEHQGNCDYHKQRGAMGPGLYFITHHMCRYLEAHVPHPDLIILDENLIGGFKLEEQCSEAQMRTLRRVEPDNPTLGQILFLAGSLSTQPDSEALIINGRKLTGADSDEDTIVSLLATQKNVTEREVKEEIFKLCKRIREIKPAELFKQHVDLKALHWLEGLTSYNLYSYLQVDKAANIYFKTKYLTPLGFEGTPVKILDATGDKRVAQSLTGRDVSLVTADVKWDAKKIHIKTETSRRILKLATDSDLKRTLERAVSKISAKKVLLLTYQFLEERVLKIARQIDPSKEYVRYHFLGPRGINSLSDCDAVIALGLSYPNINSSLQDAYILFPRKEDEEFRHNWSDLCMGWELIQSIHRIRPVNKESVEIVLISSFWPQILPPPDEIIDLSKDKNWKEKAISALDPFVREFGFLTPDIGYLANVYVQSREEKAIWFQERVEKLFSDFVAHSGISSRLNHSVSLLPDKRWVDNGGLLNDSDAFLKDQDELDEIADQILDIYNIYIYYLVRNQNGILSQTQSRDKILAHLILDIYNVYIYYLVRYGKEVFSRVLRADPEGYRLDTTNAISLSCSNQWADLLIQCQEKYPSFEQFEIKLPHTNGKAIKGVGIKKEVLNFYRDLSQLGIIGKVNLQTYKTLGGCKTAITPLPEKVFVFHFRERPHGMLSAGFGDEVQSFFIETGGREIHDFLHSQLEKDSTIITNNGKALAKAFRSSGIEIREIHDIILYERIIKNGDVRKDLSIEELFKQYELPEKPDSFTLFSQMWQVWEAQMKSISELHLEQTVRLENRILWVIADLELNGIGVDGYGMIEYQDQVRDELGAIEEKISSGFPAGFNWKDEGELKLYLNTTFSLNLKGTGKECLLHLADPKSRSLMESVQRYRSLEKTNNDIERYIALVGDDDRVHDSIDQLGTKTGRFSCVLHSVPKGTLRSFFKARPGYKLVIADYSQEEARIIAGLSKDEKAIEIFKTGKGIYLEVARTLTGGNDEQSRKFCDLAKIIVLSLNNGMTQYGIHHRLTQKGFSVGLSSVEMFVRKYFEEFAGIFKWRQAVVRRAKAEKQVQTRIGRVINVADDVTDNSLFNWPVQANGADGFKLALIYLSERLQGVDARVVHTQHDEIIVEVRDGIEDQVEAIVKESMEEAFEKIIPVVPFAVEIRVAASWG
ncbi:MAG: DNA polymerase, partial [Syntrophobacteraceae bacterium]